MVGWFGSGAEGSGIVGSVVVVIGSADISAIRQSMSAILLLTCWSSATRSKGLLLSVTVGREVVRGVISLGRVSGGFAVAVDQCCAWLELSCG